MSIDFPPLAIVLPAAGIGKRMKANIAKQYLKIDDRYVLDHTIERFVHLPFVSQVLVAVAAHDEWFELLEYSDHPKVKKITGGAERAHSVFNGVNELVSQSQLWVMVHDAARPCVSSKDIEALYNQCLDKEQSGILAAPVRDTMKRASQDDNVIDTTVCRENLWHALTPQCAPAQLLYNALASQFDPDNKVNPAITDEASALELAGQPVMLVEGQASNIKITHPEDLQLAQFYLANLREQS